jgi:hypothetical protein
MLEANGRNLGHVEDVVHGNRTRTDAQTTEVVRREIPQRMCEGGRRQKRDTDRDNDRSKPSA